MKMKVGDLVVRHRSITSGDQIALLNALNEIEKINRQINFIWAFATNRKTRPPITLVSMPRNGYGLLLDNVCEDFRIWVRNSRDRDPRNVLNISLVRVLWDGEVIVTLAKLIEPFEKSQYMRCGEL